MSRPPRYLFVCTANINRSPMAAAWARHYLSKRFVAAEIRSAGTHGWEGAEAGAYTIDAMRELGFDLRDHRSQPVTDELLGWADYVVVMQPMHAERVRDGVGDAELVQLWDWIDGADHVDDPHGEPIEEHRKAAASIGEAVREMVEQHLQTRRAASRR